ncbi:MAG: cytidine deaminase [Myxococcales bacterium]|nr:cytidine deaminase [Myxococcales bacterium]
MDPIQEQLLEAAKKAAETYSYSPYSRYRVGAAVYADGQIYHGANVENASSNLGTCAERVALAHAKMHGAQKIEGIAVYCLDALRDDTGRPLLGYTMPCGGCLQWIAELAPDAWIVTSGLDKPVTIADLLPMPFRLLEPSFPNR